MRKRVQKVRCPVCRNSDILRPICTGCKGAGTAILLYKDDGTVEVYPPTDEAQIRAAYPDKAVPVSQRVTLRQGWITFMQSIGLQSASRRQREEMQKAFYAGVLWFLDILSAQLDPSSEPTPDDLKYMEQIHAELVAFNSSLVRNQN